MKLPSFQPGEIERMFVEIKVLCECGQKYKFDVEPVEGRMPFPVACPACGADGTNPANAQIAEAQPAASLPAAPAAMRMRVAHAAAPVPAAVPPSAPVAPAAGRTVKPPASSQPGSEFSLGRGVVGALIGAVVGSGLMFTLSVLAGFRFPLLGVAIGAMTGYGAKKMFNGTDTTLGFISGAIALISVGGTLYLMYGEFFLSAIISMLVAVSFAYRLASG